MVQKYYILKQSRGASKFSISCITIAELYENMGRLVGKEAVEVRISSVQEHGIRILPVDAIVAETAGKIKVGVDIPLADAIIASTALEFANGKVATDDPHFSRIKGIKAAWIA
ncbi:MAG: type II toxin-antitoxin system VapC family toxin [Nitrososphaerales archaeon]